MIFLMETLLSNGLGLHLSCSTIVFTPLIFVEHMLHKNPYSKYSRKQSMCA